MCVVYERASVDGMLAGDALTVLGSGVQEMLPVLSP